MTKRNLRVWQDFIKMAIPWHWVALEVRGKIRLGWNLHPWKYGGSVAVGASAEQRRADRERVPLDSKGHEDLGDVFKIVVAAGGL